ncbi:MAG: hypothetical protein LBE18_09230 [Planctomycetaceae bacterium]|jgi:hypothetical protein|nr:hypothetical protein [Planctomycetaceae bacterium]
MKETINVNNLIEIRRVGLQALRDRNKILHNISVELSLKDKPNVGDLSLKGRNG